MKQSCLLTTLTTILSFFQVYSGEIAIAQTVQQTNNDSINISVSDIIGISPFIQQVTGGKFPTGGTSLDSATKPTINNVITKTINHLWELQIPLPITNSNLQVQYNLSSLDHSTVSNSKIIVEEIQSMGLTTVSEDTTAGTKIITDDVKFTFDVSNIKASGDYTGNLQVDITGI
jgi:hypothetical protein